MFKLKGKSLYVKLALKVCLTVAAGNRAESVYCKTYTIRAHESSAIMVVLKTHTCTSVFCGLHNIEMHGNQCILIDMNTTAQIIFDCTSSESAISSACAKTSPID